jgi:enoyl-CoA hydratase/carnithine racemase
LNPSDSRRYQDAQRNVQGASERLTRFNEPTKSRHSTQIQRVWQKKYGAHIISTTGHAYVPAAVISSLTGTTVRMDRPDALNAMNMDAQWEMHAVWEWFDSEPTLSIAVITGTGRAFSSGADLKAWSSSMDKDADPNERMGNAPAFTPVSRRLGKQPVIAAVNGLAAGGGTEFVVNCDMVIASEEAYFVLPEVKRGVAPIGGALPRLMRIIGLQRAS